MSLSMGWPGWILFSIPSIIAMVIALNAKYGLQVESGHRNSNRFDLGDALPMGMRSAAERFRELYARLTGAS